MLVGMDVVTWVARLGRRWPLAVCHRTNTSAALPTSSRIKNHRTHTTYCRTELWYYVITVCPDTDQFTYTDQDHDNHEEGRKSSQSVLNPKVIHLR